MMLTMNPQLLDCKYLLTYLYYKIQWVVLQMVRFHNIELIIYNI